MRRSLIFFLLFIGLLGCGSPPENPLIERARALEEARRVNANWSADCSTDQVTNTRRCFAATFGTGSAPFQVYYVDQRGPFILAGSHTFPGRTPQVRFDNDRSPFTVADDAGVTAIRPQMNIVNRMQTASIAFVRYHSWPNGSRDTTVDVTGFPEAWEQLRKYLAGERAPGEQGIF